MGRFAWTTVVATSLVVAASAGAAGSRRVIEDHPGYTDYRRYCASCHGVFGDGQGPVAQVLKTPPADLTRLGERYGMPLPRNKLLPFIDGRDGRRAHGTRDMPVWGKELHRDLGGAREREAVVRGTILVILDYIEAIQAPPSTSSE